MNAESTTDKSVVPAESKTPIQKIETQVHEIGISDAVDRIAKLADGVTDDSSRDLLVTAGSDLATKLKQAKSLRVQIYEPEMKRVTALRGIFDNRIKPAETASKRAIAVVNDYNEKKIREAELVRERAEAEARRVREQAEEKKRKAEEAERQRVEAEQHRKEAEEAEKVRQEEAKKEAAAAKERAEQERREAEEADRLRKEKEETAARLKLAEEAKRVGNADKVDIILDQEKPTVPLAPEIEQAPTTEQLEAKAKAEEEERLKREEAERHAAELRKKEEDDKAAAVKAKAEAEEAARLAKEAEYKAKTTVVEMVPKDDRIRKVTGWKWRVTNIKELARAVAEGVIPPNFIGYDPLKPEKFRPSAVTTAVTTDKDKFRCPGIEAKAQYGGGFKANEGEIETDQNSKEIES